MQNIVSSFYISKNSKSKFKFFCISLKENIIPFIFCLFCVGLVFFSNTNLTAAKNGLILWATAVIPSLFPFFVATELLSHTNVIHLLGKTLNGIMRPLFNIPGEGAFAFLMGMISGYPVGAKIVNNLYTDGLCTKHEAERMLAFTNNSGPLFIIGTVGIILFGNSTIGILLFVTHILACITVGICFGQFSHKKKTFKQSSVSASSKVSSTKVNFSSLGGIMGSSIHNAISTILMIGGFVVIFSVLLSMLNQSHLLDFITNLLTPITTMFSIPTSFIKSILCGILELTNGVSMISAIPTKAISMNIVICAFLLGFGGFSVLLQVFSIVSKTDISIRKYMIGKLLQGVFAAFYTYLALQFIPFLHFDL